MRACAYVVGPHNGPGMALLELASSLNFSVVQPFIGLGSAETQAQQTPLLFFLFATVDNVETLRPVAEAIRFAGARRIRFSPMMYFSESPSEDTIRMCVEMGFDDVITMPFSAPRVQQRVARMVDRRQVFLETSYYFGPDRRGDKESGPYRRIEIVRSPDRGVSVRRDEVRRVA